MMLDAFRAAAAADAATNRSESADQANAAFTAAAVVVTLAALPQALQVRILSFLDLRSLMRARATCKSWRALVTSPALTHRLDVSSCHKRIDDAALTSIAARFGPHLGVLSLRNCWLISDAGLLSLAGGAPHLEVRYLRYHK